MFETYVIIFTLSITLILNIIASKKNFLVDKKFNVHKSFATSNLIPVTGGLIFLISCLFFLSTDDQYFKIFLFLIFFIGFLSDTNFIFSPSKRFLLQILVILIFIYINQIFINSVRIPLIDYLIENIYFKYFLTSFCFLVLINGANFIDGVNTLLLGYFLSLLIVSLLVIKKLNLLIDIQNFELLIIVISIIFVFNSFGKLLSGDGGAYLISFISGYFLIEFVNITVSISPYFVACLLWYPAYECLFSIIRKKFLKHSIANPDNKHLHQLIFIFLQKNTNLKGNYVNTATGLSINLFNIMIFYGAYQNISQTKNLILLIFISLFFYNLLYFILKKNY
jgi:UDP-N-acetylmuramyl pentapeptide phosphotransferase/UDP-N-acetylglucosamine-1-phosphate transferase